MRHTHIESYNLPQAVQLGVSPTLAASAVVRDCRFGRYTQVGGQSHIADCLLDDYSYLGSGCDLMSTDIGKFSNIANMVRV
ncbi:MAG: acetyltransferase, partial [Comamonadaceae bacterium]